MRLIEEIALLVKIVFVLGCVFCPLYLALKVHPLLLILWTISAPLAVWTVEW